MKTRPLVLILVLWAALVWAAPAGAQERIAPEAAALVDLTAKHYGPALGFRADYSLEAETAGLAGQGGPQKSKSSGCIVFARPDRLRLRQAKPHQEEIVYSPDGYWWYSAQTKEAHRFPAGQMAGTIKPFVSFFSGLDRMGRWFEVKRMTGLDEGENRMLRLTPLSVKMGLNRLDALIAPNGDIIRVSIHSLVGDVYRYSFSNISLLTEEPVEGFSFSPPIGARIIHH